MPPSANAAMESLVPVLRYRSVATAAHWLCAAFGFQLKTLVNANDASGDAIYAELMHGRGTIMLVPVGQSDLDAHMRQPDELGGVETQTCYVTVNAPEAHLQRAVQGGAEIVLPMSGAQDDQRGYSCRDLEGHLWNFGTYAPACTKIDPAAEPDAIALQKRASQMARPGARGRYVMPAVSICLVGLAAWAWAIPGNPLAATASRIFAVAGGKPASPNQALSDQSARANADLQAGSREAHETILKLRQEAADARASAKAAQEAANTSAKDLALEYARRSQSEQKSGSTAARATQLETELAASRDTIAHLESEMMKERSARGQSVQAAEAARAELEQEIKRREQLEKMVEELDRKADERLHANPDTDAKSTGAKSAVRDQSSAPLDQSSNETPAADHSLSNSIPPETGSVDVSKNTTEPSDTKASGKSKPAKASAPERPKTVAKRPKSVTQASSSGTKKPSAGKEDKPWPYNAW